MVIRSFFRRVAALLSAAVVLLPGCRLVDPEPAADFGLPVYELSLAADDLAELNAHFFSSRGVPAILQHAGKRHTIDLRIQGRTSRRKFRKNFRLTFSSEDPLLGRPQVILSSQAGDPSRLRSALGFKLFAAAGLPTPQYRFVALYINHEYAGLYLLLEQIDERFLAARELPALTLYKAVNARARFSLHDGYDVREGYESELSAGDHFNDLQEFLRRLDQTPPAELASMLTEWVDIEAYLRYLAVSVTICNWEGFFNNFYLLRNRDTGRFQILPWDLDLTFQPHPTRCSVFGANALTEKILQVPEFRCRYAEILRDLLDGPLSPAAVRAQASDLASMISRAHAADPLNAAEGNELPAELDELLEFFAASRQRMLTEIPQLQCSAK